MKFFLFNPCFYLYICEFVTEFLFQTFCVYFVLLLYRKIYLLFVLFVGDKMKINNILK